MSSLLPLAYHKKSPAFGRIWFVILGLAFAAGVFAPSHAAWADITYQSGGSGSCVQTSSQTCNVSNLTLPAGTLVVVMVTQIHGTLPQGAGVTDSKGNTYSQDVHHPSSSDWEAYIYHTVVQWGKDGSGITVTFTSTRNDDYIDMHVLAFSAANGWQSLPLDRSNHAGTSSQPTSPVTLTAGTTSQAEELFVGHFGDYAGASPSAPGWTRQFLIDGNSNASFYKMVSAVQTVSLTVSDSANNGSPYDQLVATYMTAVPQGGQVSSRSDTLSDSRPSATSNHSIAFKVNTSLDTTSPTATDTLALTFASKFDLNNIYCKDVDLSIGGTATSIAGTFSSRATSKNCPGSATSWGLFIDPVATTITFYTPTGVRTWVNAGTQLSIKVGTNASFQDTGTAQIVNPSTPGTYTISVGGTFGGSGNMPVSINAGFEVAATMAESLSLTVSPSVTSIKYVQGNFTNLTSANPTVDFISNNTTGNLIVLALGWDSQSAVVNSITDTQGNTYVSAVGPVNGQGGVLGNWRDQIFYAENVAGGANTVTIHFSSAVTSELYIHEYSGVDQSSPLDVTASSVGNSATPNSGFKTTNFANELVFGYCQTSGSACTHGTNFATRRTDNDNLSEDMIATSTGSYSASANKADAGDWIMSMATFKPTLNCAADDGATVNQVSTTGNAVPFGTVSPNTFYQGCQDIAVSTNAPGGYSLSVQESYAMRTASGGYTIPDTTCNAGTCTHVTAASWTDPNKNGYGHTCYNQSMHDCDASYGTGADSGKYFRQFASMSDGDTAQAIMASSTPAIATGRIKHRLSAPSSAAAGTYTTMIMYTILGTF